MKSLSEYLQDTEDSYSVAIAQTIFDGSLPMNRLRELAIQVYLQEKWPSHAANVYMQMDELALANKDLIYYVLSIIKAENLGVGSKGVSHADLAKRFALSIGIQEDDLATAVPTIENRSIMDWCDMSELTRPWLETLAVQVACEGQVIALGKVARGITRHYGISKYDAELWYVHGGSVERRHKKEGLALLEKYTTEETMDDVKYAYSVTTRLNCEFFNSFGA